MYILCMIIYVIKGLISDFITWCCTNHFFLLFLLGKNELANTKEWNWLMFLLMSNTKRNLSQFHPHSITSKKGIVCISLERKLLLQCLNLFSVLKSNSVTFQLEWYKKIWENWVLKSLTVTSIYILTSLGNCRSMCFEVKENCSFPLKCVYFTQEYVFLVQTVVWLVNLIFATPSFQSPLFVAMALDYLTANASPE